MAILLAGVTVLAHRSGTSELRGDIMRVAKNRQLIALSIAVLLSTPAFGEERAASATDRLNELRLTQARLAATAAGDAEWKQLDVAFNALADQRPRNPSILAARGSYRWERGAHAGAFADWTEAIRLDPQQPTALAGLADVALESGDTTAAARLQRRATLAQPENPAAHFALANVLYLFRHELHDAEHPDDAILLRDSLAHFREAARLAPMNLEYARGFAETFYLLPQPDWDDARMAWEKVRDLSVTKDFAWVNLARVHLRMGQPEAAQAYLDLVQSPDFQRVKARLKLQLPAHSQ